VKPSRLLVYCRAGFERECAQEITALAGEMTWRLLKARPESAFAVFQPHQDDMGRARHTSRSRGSCSPPARPHLEPLTLPEDDRVAPIVAAARKLGHSFSALLVEMPDNNDGKALSTLTRPLTPHLERGLSKAGVDFADPKAEARLHVFFVGSLACHVGISDPGNASRWPMGIPRLRMPRAAPSRSTLKLAEAIDEFLDESERAKRLVPGMTAVDLGASPGGWTWLLVQRGLMVTAVDNGAMDPALMETGQVKYRRDDGFHFKPTESSDWMVCDMVESPSRIARLASGWIAQEWCRETIFNLKLPMKKRWEEVQRCRGIIDEALGGAGYFLRMKQLYHDREEITCYLSRQRKTLR
jgi:23S rRNA (cytidine2498-2'-O)-methyltransferase